MLPRVKIDFLSGQLGKVGTSPDGLVALLIGATAVVGTFELNKSYSLRNYADLQPLGITEENNPDIERHVRAFYREAGGGKELVICGADPAKKMAELCAKEDGAVRDLIERHSGALRAVFVSSSAGDSAPVTEGLSSDVFNSLAPAQELAEWATKELFAPLFIILDGRSYTGKSLRDLGKTKYNRVGVFVGDTEQTSKGSALGVLAGRIASAPVQRNIGRVRDGALKPEAFYLGGKPVEEKSSAIAELHEKRYICPRRYVGRSGYFLADDNLAVEVTDDYAQIASRRVIDKAYRIAYDTLLDYLNDEIELNEDGTMNSAELQSWEMTVEQAIDSAMTAKGELSNDDGKGCSCYIDPSQNIAESSTVKLSLKVRPHGYARYIDVDLGFQVNTK